MGLFSFARSPRAAHVQRHSSACFTRSTPGLDYYEGVVIGAKTIGELAIDQETQANVAAIMRQLGDDDYLSYVREYVAAGARLASERWRYADIVTALFAAAELIQPKSYLEIGVRRGRSMAIVASRAPECSIVGVDLWEDGYAAMENPGPELVRAELAKVGFEGGLRLLEGNSHRVLPRLFRDANLSFDLITVDGDHTRRGARRDLLEVLPRLRVGGVLVFDDIRHSAHPELHDVWKRTLGRDRRYTTWEFDDIGYGVGLAVRRW